MNDPTRWTHVRRGPSTPGHPSRHPGTDGLASVPAVLALESSLSAVATADMEGRLTYVNPAFVTMWGYASRDEVLGRHVVDFWQDPEGPLAVIASLHQTGSGVGELEGRRQDGSRFWTELFATQVKDEHGHPVGMLGSFVDITDRKRVEAELRAQEERLRLAIGGTNMGLYDLDLATGVAVVSPEYATQLGYDPATFTADIARWGELLHQDDHDRVVTLLRSCACGDVPGYNTEYRLRTRDGGCKWVQSVGKAIVSADTGRPERLLGIHIDISDRKRTEAVVLESRRLYEDLVSSVPLGVYRIEPAPDGLRYVYVNDRYCSTLGLSREVIMADARATVDIIHPADRPGFEQLNEHALVHGRPFNWEGRVIVGGTARWLHVDAHPSRDLSGATSWTGFVMDVTTRRLADNALRSSEYFLARSQEVTRLGSFEFDTQDGTWVCTATLDDILGIDHRNPKLFSEWVDRLAPDIRDEMLRYVTEHVLGGGNRFEREYRIVRLRDGAERWVLGLAEVEYDSAGHPLKMIGTIQDVTDRKRAEDERLELERRLLHTQKLESLGLLAGGIAHDFNNLLMAILGNLDLALSQISPVSSARTSIEHSLAAARRAADLTRQMLAYSGKASFDVRTVDVNEIVHENVHLFRACIPKLVHLSLNLGQPMHAIVADAGQVQQVIMNLITNAAEAIGEHAGVITLTTRVQELDAEALRASRVEECPAPGLFVCLEVTDTGCGMDAHTQQRLFDPFFTTKLMGRGLGMSAILGIVRGHQGAIMVESEPGSGSTIRVLFPAGDPLPTGGRSDPAGSPADVAAGAATPGFVLVVDDEDMVRDVCRRMLRQAGWAVLDADGGQAALDVFAAHADDIACVILDLSMPQMDGFSVFRALRAIRPDVRVILSSGYSRNHEPGMDLAAEGFAGFIQKPYAAKTLRDEVARVVAGSPKP